MIFRKYKIYEYPQGFVPVRGWGIGSLFFATAFLKHYGHSTTSHWFSIYFPGIDKYYAETLEEAGQWIRSSISTPLATYSVIITKP